MGPRVGWIALQDIKEFLFGLVLTIALSSLSFRYFEAPFLRLKEKFQFVSRGEAARS